MSHQPVFARMLTLKGIEDKLRETARVTLITSMCTGTVQEIAITSRINI